jgi:hypothetical protein
MVLDKPIIAADRQYAREICGPYATYVDPERPEALVDIWRTGSWRRSASTPDELGKVFDRFSWRRHVARLLGALLGDGDWPGAASEGVAAVLQREGWDALEGSGDLLDGSEAGEDPELPCSGW